MSQTRPVLGHPRPPPAMEACHSHRGRSPGPATGPARASQASRGSTGHRGALGSHHQPAPPGLPAAPGTGRTVGPGSGVHAPCPLPRLSRSPLRTSLHTPTERPALSSPAWRPARHWSPPNHHAASSCSPVRGSHCTVGSVSAVASLVGPWLYPRAGSRGQQLGGPQSSAAETPSHGTLDFTVTGMTRNAELVGDGVGGPRQKRDLN